MPIYEYCCRDCGHEFEIMQRFSDEPVADCPDCEGRVDKLISQSTFHLKGTGWYATDYGTKSHGGTSGKNKSVENEDTSGSEDKVSKSEEKKKEKKDD